MVTVPLVSFLCKVNEVTVINYFILLLKITLQDTFGSTVEIMPQGKIHLMKLNEVC